MDAKGLTAEIMRGYERPTYHLEWSEDDGSRRVLDSDDLLDIAHEVKRQQKLHHHFLVCKGSVVILEA